MYGVSNIEAFDNVALISFKKIPCQASLLAEIFDAFARNSINLDMISQTSPISDRVSISFTCFDRDMVQALAIINQLKERHPELRPLVSNGNCKLYLFGEEMRQTPGVFAKAMRCLSSVSVEPQLVTTSEADISILVAATQMDEALAALKAAF